MPWRRIAPAQVEAAVGAMINGLSMRDAAKTAGVTTSTLARWCVCGAPVDAPGIPANTPLLAAAHRRMGGAAVDGPLSDAEQLALMRIAANHLLRVTGDFIEKFGGSEVT